MFSDDIHTVYEQLTLPVWMSHGVRGDFVDYRAKSIVEGRDNWRFNVFATGALPHFEVPDEFEAAYDAFLATDLRVPRRRSDQQRDDEDADHHEGDHDLGQQPGHDAQPGGHAHLDGALRASSRAPGIHRWPRPPAA